MVVLAVDDERRCLRKACDRLARQLEEAREIAHGQAMCVRDLERGLRDAYQNLFAIKRQLRKRVRSITLNYEVVLDMAAEAPPRATGPELIGEVDTLGSVGDWGPRRGA